LVACAFLTAGFAEAVESLSLPPSATLFAQTSIGQSLCPFVFREQHQSDDAIHHPVDGFASFERDLSDAQSRSHFPEKQFDLSAN